MRESVFYPTPYIGVYQHASTLLYHLRNLRTGRIIQRSYPTVGAALHAQKILEEGSPDQLKILPPEIRMQQGGFVYSPQARHVFDTPEESLAFGKQYERESLDQSMDIHFGLDATIEALTEELKALDECIRGCRA